MAYTPDPTDSSQPVASVKASTAAAEFRALKAYIAALAGLTPITAISALTVQQLNGGPLAGFRNRIINGGMTIDQRYAATAYNLTSAATYHVDRWAVFANATPSGTLTAQRVSGDAASPRALRFAKTAGTYNNALYAAQVIESFNCYTFTGKTVTLSFRARVGSSWSGANTPVVALRTGTTADEGLSGGLSGAWTGYINRSLTTVAAPALSTAFQTYTYTADLTGTTAEVLALIGCTTTAAAGSANDYFEFTDVQLEVGTVATPFEHRFFSTELALCQRYYFKSYNQDSPPASITNAGSVYGITNASGWAYISLALPVSMRATPSGTLYNALTGATGTWQDGGGTARAVSLLNSGMSIATIQCTTAAINSLLGGHLILGAEL